MVSRSPFLNLSFLSWLTSPLPYLLESEVVGQAGFRKLLIDSRW